MTPIMSSTAQPLVQVRNATFGYNGVGVLRNVSFTVSSGEVVVVTGHNGSGKSTLTKGMLGLCDLLSGSVDMFGTSHNAFERSRVGYVPQRHTAGGPLPATVQEVVSSGRLGRLPWYKWLPKHDHKIVDQAIDMVDLTSQRDTQVDNLSGGQQRRALIARALTTEPELMLMDEPTAGVDIGNQRLLVKALIRLVDQGMALVIVSHELEPLLPIATRQVTVAHGQIVDDQRVSRAARSTSPLRAVIPEQHTGAASIADAMGCSLAPKTSTEVHHDARLQFVARRNAARPGRVLPRAQLGHQRVLKPAAVTSTHEFLWR